MAWSPVSRKYKGVENCTMFVLITSYHTTHTPLSEPTWPENCKSRSLTVTKCNLCIGRRALMKIVWPHTHTHTLSTRMFVCTEVANEPFYIREVGNTSKRLESCLAYYWRLCILEETEEEYDKPLRLRREVTYLKCLTEIPNVLLLQVTSYVVWNNIFMAERITKTHYPWASSTWTCPAWIAHCTNLVWV
jgi:hypothetical protein